jgi:hypothetical protein
VETTGMRATGLDPYDLWCDSWFRLTRQRTSAWPR